MNYSTGVQALAIAAALLSAAGQADAAPAHPSFDCRTHNGTREKAVCRNERLAALDRAMDAAYRAALKRLDQGAAKAIRADQRKFVTALDDGFVADLMGKDAKGPEEQEAALKEALALPDSAPIGGLEEELKSRVEMLNAIDTGRPGFAGVWRNANVQLTVREEGGGYKAGFDYQTYGWAKYHCELTLDLASKDGQLSSTAAHNRDIDTDYENPILLTRDGAVLHLKESEAANFNGWSCPHVPGLDETLIAVRAGKPKPRE